MNGKSLTKCLESDTQIAIQLLQKKNVPVYSCRNGLTHAVASIVIQGEYIANIFVGQFLLSSPDIEFFRRTQGT